MKKKLSFKQVKYAAAAYLISSILLAREVYLFLQQEALAGVVLGYLICRVFVWVYGKLAKRFPGKSLRELAGQVFGKVLGTLVSLLYLYYFFCLLILNTRDLGDFVSEMILPKTPMAVIVALFLAVCAMAVRSGMRNLARGSFLMVMIILISVVTNGLLLLKEMDYEHFLPLLTNPVHEYFVAAHFMAALPFGEVFVLYALEPHMERPEEMGRAMKEGLNLAFAVFLLVVLRDVAVLGEYIEIATMPSFSVLRLINIGDVLTRLEMIYAVLLIGQLFFKVTLLYSVVQEHLCGLLRLSDPKILIHIVGAAALVFSLVVFNSYYESAEWLDHTATLFSTVFIMILPAALLLTAVVRRRPTVDGKPPTAGGAAGEEVQPQ